MHSPKSAKKPVTTSQVPNANELNKTGKRLNQASVDFLKTDVETALTFSGIALETEDQQKKRRNRKNARKAYDTILRLSTRVDFKPAERTYMTKMMDRLKSDLSLLGESF